MIKYLIFALFLIPAAAYSQIYIKCEPLDTAALLSLRQNIDLQPTPDQSVMTRQLFQSEIKPFFCNIEHQMNRTSKLPVYFRLGSKEYVDRMEGK